MKLQLLNTEDGLKPCYDEDFDNRKKLEIGRVYEAEIRLVRNPQFQRKFFSMIRAAWDLLPESTRGGFRTVENFRSYLTVAAGFCETFYSPRVGQFVEYPKSTAFASMDEAEFNELYKGVRDVIDKLIGSRITPEEFDRYLLNY